MNVHYNLIYGSALNSGYTMVRILASNISVSDCVFIPCVRLAPLSTVFTLALLPIYLSLYSSSFVAIGDVYMKGVAPVSQDDQRVLEYYERTLQLDLPWYLKDKIYKSTQLNLTLLLLVLSYFTLRLIR